MTYVIQPAAIPTVPVHGGGQFPVRRIYCVGRNYVEHAQEMGHSGREPPFFFLKPADAALPVPEGETGTLEYPPLTSNLHHEVELVAALGRGGRDIAVERALEHVFGYAVGIDLTRRDLQAAAKKAGAPWDTAKGFDHSAPVSAIVPVDALGEHPARGPIWLEVNGARKQSGDLAQMIWDVPHQIEFLSGLFELRAGDLIFTGTPAGVSAIKKGDRLKGHVDGVGDLDVTVV